MPSIPRRVLAPALFLGVLVLAPTPRAHAQATDTAWVRAHYRKVEAEVPMRDGVTLHTAVYLPRDTAGRRFGILLTRTAFGAAPYGADRYPRALGPGGNPAWARAGYIFAVQDVRGLWYSGGTHTIMRPVAARVAPGTVDETTDTEDTVRWLLAHATPHNGRVALHGASWPGFFALAGCVRAPAAVVGCTAGAPIVDIWNGDDAFEHGAFHLASIYFGMYRMGRRTGPTPGPQPFVAPEIPADPYAFYLDFLPIGARARSTIPRDSGPIWHELTAHPTRDAFVEARDLSRRLGGVTAPVLLVGGWFDAEDLVGPWRAWRALRATAPAVDARIVVGPWAHVAWWRGDDEGVGGRPFGGPQAPWFRDSIEGPWLRARLAGAPPPPFKRVTVFETGANAWRQYDEFPPRTSVARTLYLQAGGALAWTRPPARLAPPDRFVSDPWRPVPTQDGSLGDEGIAPEFMVADQRAAARRPDVLTYRSAVLARDLVVTGPLSAVVHFSTSGTDADVIVKLID